MPFKQQQPRIYTRTNVEMFNPGQIGVYGLLKQGRWVEWIYVGKGDIRQRLLDHLNGDNPCITKSGPTHWVAEVTGDYDNREKTLIVELDPTCNQKVG